MKEAYLTEDGKVHEKVEMVYISEDKKYFHKERENVKIYEILKIKDIDKLIPKEYIYNEEKYINPEINTRTLTIEYKSRKNEEVIFEIDINFNKNSIKNGKPRFWRYDKELETYIEIYEEEIENIL